MTSRRNGRYRGTVVVALMLALGFTLPGPADAAKHTPGAWLRLVKGHPHERFNGQFKHVGWVRDRNQNFIDDMIDGRFGAGDSVNVIVELNERIPPDRTAVWLRHFGTIAYFGRLISCAYVQGVPFGRLDSLAESPAVAMVEWQVPIRPALDVAARTVQAVQSTYYAGDVAARDWGKALGGPGLDGTGINVAIIDDGIWDDHPALKPAFVGGFDATKFEDFNFNEIDDTCEGAGATCTDPATDEKGDGLTNPLPRGGQDHGTHMAGIVAARPIAGADCRAPGDGSPPNECSGIAPAAGLFDIKACTGDVVCAWATDVMEGIDWVGLNASSKGIRVANISLYDGADDDGTSALCQAVNYLAAIGVIPVVSHGNAGSAGASGAKETASPGAASFAITVAAIDDNKTIKRTDDGLYSEYLIGPRDNPLGVLYDPLAFKPDISAPGQSVMTTAYAPSSAAKYFEHSGTSVAAAIVSGAAALVVQQRNWIDAGSLKDLLQATADKAMIPATGWDDAYGAGVLNLSAAVGTAATGDLLFDSCDGFGATSMAPCPLKLGVPAWNNYMDIVTRDPPQAGNANVVTVMVRNDGAAAANVIVSFGVYRFGAGTRLFHAIGNVEKRILPGVPTPVSIDWTPSTEAHQCVQAHIQYGLDSEFRNNTTQRNLAVAPSEYPMDVENPFMTRAQFHVAPISDRQGWNCTVDQADFELGAAEGPKQLRISFHAPRSARPGQRANCDVAVYGKPSGARDSVLIGGVTVQTYVPKPCRLVGQVVGTKGDPISGATLRFHLDLPKGLLPAPWERDRVTVTDAYGVFALEVLPDVPHRLRLTRAGIRKGEILLRPTCGVGTLRVELGKQDIRLLQ